MSITNCELWLSYLKFVFYRVLLRWANHVLCAEHNIWRYYHFLFLGDLPINIKYVSVLFLTFAIGQRRALILYVAAGALQEALAALREAQQPDTAAMFILACHESHAEFVSHLGRSDDESMSLTKDTLANLPGLNPENEDVIAVSEYYGQYQRKLVHLCMDSQPFAD